MQIASAYPPDLGVKGGTMCSGRVQQQLRLSAIEREVLAPVT